MKRDIAVQKATCIPIFEGNAIRFNYLIARTHTS